MNESQKLTQRDKHLRVIGWRCIAAGISVGILLVVLAMTELPADAAMTTEATAQAIDTNSGQVDAVTFIVAICLIIGVWASLLAGRDAMQAEQDSQRSAREKNLDQ